MLTPHRVAPGGFVEKLGGNKGVMDAESSCSYESQVLRLAARDACGRGGGMRVQCMSSDSSPAASEQ
jgi:hypothetical protein